MTPDTINAMLEEGGKFATAEVTFPLNISGDAEGLHRSTGPPMLTPKASRRPTSPVCGGRLGGAVVRAEFGGQGLPHVVNQCLYDAQQCQPGLDHVPPCRTAPMKPCWPTAPRQKAPTCQWSAASGPAPCA